MRHKIFFILFLLSLYVVYISCTDLLNDSSKEGQWTSSFSLDEARTYFEENAEDLQPLTLSARVKTRNDGASAVELTPNWDCATIEHNSEVTLFLIPLRSISVPLVNATIFKDGKFEYKYHPESERRLLIAKRSNGDMEMFVTTIIPEIENTDNDAKEMLKNFRYLSGDNKFCGKVFISELNGQLIKGFGYTNGRNNGTLTLAFNSIENTEEGNHNHDSEHGHSLLMSISFQESTVIMTRGVGGEYYIVCSICGGNAENCECIVIKACRICGEQNGCKCAKCSNCGEMTSECICVCKECFFPKWSCQCGWYEVEYEQNHHEGSETPDNNKEYDEAKIKLARGLFHNSEFTDSQWTKIGDLLEKIIRLCMGGNLYDMLFNLQKGETMYISIAEDYNGKFGHKVINNKHVIRIVLGEQLDCTQLLHEMMHAHRYLTINDTAKYNSSRLNGEIEAKFAQLVFADTLKAIKDNTSTTTPLTEAIKKLNRFIDYKGNFIAPMTDLSLLDFEITFAKVIEAYHSIDGYKNYQYEDRTDLLSNFENLRTISSNCP